MTPHDFIAKWGPGGPSHELNERQGAQGYFMDLCHLLDVPTPGSAGASSGSDNTNNDYVFERDALLLGAARGFADVFYRDHFAWENKAPGRNLDSALKQLLGYSLALSNPPLLVVCDRLTIRIHTQFNGHPSEVHTVLLAQLDQPEKRSFLRRLWTDPESFRPQKTSRAITEQAAHSFATLADLLRKRGHSPERVSHFLTQCLFCFFAEDVGLLPGRMFERMVGNKKLTSDRLTVGLASLFSTMQVGGLYGADDIPWFNGGLFKIVDVPKLEILDITELRNAASLNWSAIDVSIFGTLFERGLDPAKRSQLGAHYTDPATINRIVQPVIARPLLAEWAAVREVMAPLMAKSKKHGDASYRKAHETFIAWLERLRNYRVLDPACGSGNFLFMALKTLKDIEHLSHTEAATLGLDRETDLVTGPHNVLGIELNEYAAELARVTVWIGELQWRIDHGYEFKVNPVLEPLEHIECRDALLNADGSEAVWPKADAAVGNPPFLGDKKMRAELGDEYTETLRRAYEGHVPGGADLVCYWFEKARDQIGSSRLVAAGLVATNSIRGGKNRVVLDAISSSTRIFEAWSDEGWVNEGAAVRVSLVAFGHGSQPASLNGLPAGSIHSDLSGGSQKSTSLDLSLACATNNRGTSFIGTQKGGPFDVPGRLARTWLGKPNPHQQPNSKVLFPWVNGLDITRRPQDLWIIDFGILDSSSSCLFELPWQHCEMTVRPTRQGNREDRTGQQWWLLQRSRPEMKAALRPLVRYMGTARVAKFRLFSWLPSAVVPDSQVVAFARADDATFGILHSRFHESWSLRMCTWLGVGNDPRYTPTTCFETFPFPTGLTPADTAHQQTETLSDGAQIPAGLTGPLRDAAARIASAAHRLDTLRRAWLNPPEWTVVVPEVVPLGMEVSPYPDRIEPKPGLGPQALKALSDRTLTKLYNQRPAWLDSAHRELDAAVAAAYALTEALTEAQTEVPTKAQVSPQGQAAESAEGAATAASSSSVFTASTAFTASASSSSSSADFWHRVTPETPDDAILAQLLAMNLRRAGAGAGAGKDGGKALGKKAAKNALGAPAEATPAALARPRKPRVPKAEL